MTSSVPEPEENTSESFLARIARSFYLEDLSKVEIAQQYGISRFKVARCLQEAKDKGIVQITIRSPQDQQADLSVALQEHLGIQQVVLVAPSRDIVLERRALGAAAADLLSRHVRRGFKVGMSWGRTLLPIAEYLGDIPPAIFVQLTGVVGNDPSQSPIEIIGGIQRRSGSIAKALIAPLLSATPSLAQALKEEPAVAEVMKLYDSLDMAFLSIGAWRPRVNQLAQHIAPEDQEELDNKGVYVEFGGIFFDREGRYVDTHINDCRLAVSVEQLLATPMVTAVAGQSEKANAIHSICFSGIVTHLITTTEVAQALLDMPKIANPVYVR
ncbi:sugar-binding transcriptional regulator [Schaalia sp. lx-260]|uniref:sugar-binding transcriptional regulator n=1 Tax=Schaalia sp. lx-260 TaxID=2899082 RepID=UPI001E2EEDB7|nr:sugar-binding domain-containing protein [Schaalia sp. lx-260]MCD4548943.1 hypothetical protein [Schaalia sp. lx-260]